jgi:glutathione peroxidase
MFDRSFGLMIMLTTTFLGTTLAMAAEPSFIFNSIDGGSINTADWRGKPVLVVNTASMCGYTPQYEDLQALSDQYAGKAVVLAVPSNDFNQELATDAEVKEFCEVNFGITLPMSTTEHVEKGAVHPMFVWLAAEHGFVPNWNFNKVLIGPDGAFIQSWGSNTNPMSAAITKQIEQLIKEQS